MLTRLPYPSIRAITSKAWWLPLILAVLFSSALNGQEKGFQFGDVNCIPVKPSDTDPAITEFDDPHALYINPQIIVSQNPKLPADRHQLLLFLNGTRPPGTPHGGVGPYTFLGTAASLGYHVVDLTYPDDIAAAQVCNNDRDPRAFERFRMAIIAGGSFRSIAVSQTDSIENRLAKLLLYLKGTRSQEHWEQFLNADGSIKWDSIAVAGQSQGGGHAALIAVKYHVARVICSGAPKDYSHALHRPAAWYEENSATPKGCFFAINHRQDDMGACTPAEQMDNLRALGLDSLGAPADVDTEKAPYHHARILTTNYPGGTIESKAAHTTVLNPKYGDTFKEAWTYMLTEPVE